MKRLETWEGLPRAAALAFVAGAAACMTGCMSMDDMLASDNALMRSLGETRAVSYATDTGPDATTEQRVAVVGKIQDQEKLAQIYVAPRAAAEVKKAARERMTEPKAFVVVLTKTDDPALVQEAVAEVAKDADASLDAAWQIATRKPGSPVPETLLSGVTDNVKVSKFLAGKVNDLIDQAGQIEKHRKQFGDDYAKREQKELFATAKVLIRLLPLVKDEETVTGLLAYQEVRSTAGTEIDLFAPLQETGKEILKAQQERAEKAAIREEIMGLTDAQKIMLLTVGTVRLPSEKEISRDDKTGDFVCGIATIPSVEIEESIADKDQLAKVREQIAAAKAAAEAKRKRRETLVKVAAKYRGLPQDKRAGFLAKVKDANDRLIMAWELAAGSGSDADAAAAAGEIAGGLGDTKVAKFLRDEINSQLKNGAEGVKAAKAAAEVLAPYAKDELILSPLCAKLAEAGHQDIARPLKAVADKARVASLDDKDIRKILKGEILTKEDKYNFKMGTGGLGYNGIYLTRDDLIAALHDEAFRNRLLKEDKLYKDAMAALGGDKAEAIAQRVVLALKDNGFANEQSEDYGLGHYSNKWQCILAMVCNDIRKKDTSLWLRAAKSFDDDPEAQVFFIRYLVHDTWSDEDDPKTAAAQAQMLALVPQATLEQMFNEMAYCREGLYSKDEVYRAFSFVGALRCVAKAIKDKEIIKRLLFDYDGWARYRNDTNSRTLAYQRLVDNLGDDEDAIWRLYADTAPTKKCDVISLGYLSGLGKKLGEAKRKELTDAALARAEAFSKTNIVVKGYYLGMSLADFRAIDTLNGERAKGVYDNPQSRKMIKIVFNRGDYQTFLGLDTGNPISDIEKFDALYGHVQDGVDVSEYVRFGIAFRDQMSLEGYNSETAWKWVDTYHKFQAEIDDSAGTLTLRPPVVEGLFNDTDIRKEQANAIIDVFAGTDDDDDVDYYDE